MKGLFKSKFGILGLAAVLVLVAATSAIVFAMGNSDKAETYSWRYKLTVQVDTPEGVKTGSVVRENDVRLIPYPNDPRRPFRTNTKIKGEAVVIDLGKRGILFALLNADDYRLVFNAFPGPPGLTPKGLKYYQGLKNVKAIIPLGPDPALVTFGNLKDPTTVKAITDYKRENNGWPSRPVEFVDRTQEVFGPDVKIKSISIEMTDEPVTTGVIKLLPWLPEFYNKRLDGNRFGTIKAQNIIANGLASGAFSTEESPNGR